MRIADTRKSDESFRVPRPQRPIYTPDAAGIWADIPSFTTFAQEVFDALDGPDLRYSQRLKLIKRADHFGIRRFDANLIIAMVQHRVAQTYVPPAKLNIKSKGWKTTIAVVAALQTVIVIAGWWLLA